MKKFYLLLLTLFIMDQAFSQLIINEVLYDPSNTELEGDANADGVYDQEADSFIELYNSGNAVLDLSGYQVWDDTLAGALRYTFPPNTLLKPHRALVVFGGGTPTGDFGGATVLVADTSAVGLNLNNSGEIIVIRDSTGQAVLSFDSDALSNNPNESYTRVPDITGDFDQHGNVVAGVLFSPGTLADGTPFGLDLVPSLSLRGILDLGLSGSSGKAVHLIATGNIDDLALYGIGVANNGGGTDGQEYTFPEMTVSAGDDILVARDIEALTSYFGSCIDEFEHILLANDGISQNGDDAIELFFAAEVIETFGDPDVDGTGEDWEYTDSWAYFTEGSWIYGGIDCTDNATNNLESDCPYPFCSIPDVLVESIMVTGEDGKDYIDVLGGSLQIFAEVLPADASDPSILWSVENLTGFATLTEDGLLTAVGDGTVEVTAAAVDGSGVSGSLIVTISNQMVLEAALELRGVLDLGLSGSSGKALHLYTTGDIASLSTYGAGVANNGGGTDGQEYVFPDVPVGAGKHILLARDTVALMAYFESCFEEFDLILEATDAISQNGDDAIELYFLDEIIEIFGDPEVDGTGEPWEYLDSWAYKIDGEWTYGGVSCTAGATTNLTSDCPYPFCPTTGLFRIGLDSSIQLYPNPVSDLLHLQLNTDIRVVDIYSTDGKLMYRDNGNKRVIDVSTWQAGIYFLKAIHAHGIDTARFIRN
jgi:hypothetical protein